MFCKSEDRDILNTRNQVTKNIKIPIGTTLTISNVNIKLIPK